MEQTKEIEHHLHFCQIKDIQMESAWTGIKDLVINMSFANICILKLKHVVMQTSAEDPIADSGMIYQENFLF